MGWGWEWRRKLSHSCHELGQIRKSHSCLSYKDSELTLLNLLGEKSQVQIKEGGARELAGLYTAERLVSIPSSEKANVPGATQHLPPNWPGWASGSTPGLTGSFSLPASLRLSTKGAFSVVSGPKWGSWEGAPRRRSLFSLSPGRKSTSGSYST